MFDPRATTSCSVPPLFPPEFVGCWELEANTEDPSHCVRAGTTPGIIGGGGGSRGCWPPCPFVSSSVVGSVDIGNVLTLLGAALLVSCIRVTVTLVKSSLVLGGGLACNDSSPFRKEFSRLERRPCETSLTRVLKSFPCCSMRIAKARCYVSCLATRSTRLTSI